VQSAGVQPLLVLLLAAEEPALTGVGLKERPPQQQARPPLQQSGRGEHGRLAAAEDGVPRTHEQPLHQFRAQDGVQAQDAPGQWRVATHRNLRPPAGHVISRGPLNI